MRDAAALVSEGASGRCHVLDEHGGALSTGKAHVSVGSPVAAVGGSAEQRREADRLRRAAEARRRRQEEERRRAERGARARIDAEAERTIDRVLARERAIVASAHRVEQALGANVALPRLPALERASGEPVPAEWLSNAERALAQTVDDIATAQRRGAQAALARLAEAERRTAERTSARDARAARWWGSARRESDAASVGAHPADAEWRVEVVVAAERNRARLAAAHDLDAHEHGGVLEEGIVAAAQEGDERLALDRLAQLRSLVQQVNETRDRVAYDAARAGVLREQLVRLRGDDADVHPEWTGHLDRVVLGLEPLDVEVDRRISDHVIAESLAIALEAYGYAVGESFSVDLVDGGPATARRDDPDADGHAVRFALLPGSVIDFYLATDTSLDPDRSDFAAFERRWCDEDLPILAAALDAQGMVLTVDERSLPGECPPQRVADLRVTDRRRAGTRRPVDEPQAREVR